MGERTSSPMGEEKGMRGTVLGASCRRCGVALLGRWLDVIFNAAFSIGAGV